MERKFVSVVLSRPEHYLSMYQSGCNLKCKKCHSADFSQKEDGRWLSTEDLAEAAASYAKQANVYEPSERWTMYHAEDLCRGCGACVHQESPSPLCPGTIQPEQLILSQQGLGPARNLVAFTGGEITCRPEYYAEAATAIRRRAPDLHVLVETNAVALDEEALHMLKEGGVEAFWLDIKAFDPDVHRELTGYDNTNTLAAPEKMHKLGFIFEVLSLYIPGMVETDQLFRIAELVATVSEEIPFTLLAFFPAYQMEHQRNPTFNEMMKAGDAIKKTGIRNLRLGNLGVFCKTQQEMEQATSYR